MPVRNARYGLIALVLGIAPICACGQWQLGLGAGVVDPHDVSIENQFTWALEAQFGDDGWHGALRYSFPTDDPAVSGTRQTWRVQSAAALVGLDLPYGDYGEFVLRAGVAHNALRRGDEETEELDFSYALGFRYWVTDDWALRLDLNWLATELPYFGVNMGWRWPGSPRR